MIELGELDEEDMASIKWRNFEVYHLIAIWGEMDEEFAKTANKQGEIFFYKNFIIKKKIECWRMMAIVGCKWDVWWGHSLRPSPSLPTFCSQNGGGCCPGGWVSDLAIALIRWYLG